MPAVDKAYNVSKNREQRAIAGLSMGAPNRFMSA